jgi:ubiquinone/menaquinone biosynthesis C-methylase UbiE
MTTQPQEPNLGAIKERQQKAWSSGDYGKVGVTLVIMAERLCEAADLRSGQQVLDVATGNGNAALAAARRFCDVIGIDYVPMLLEEGRERAKAERLQVDFWEGDAEKLSFTDASFDVVLSTLGVMFAPNQERVASELLRVCRPGGRICLANWTPDGFIGHFFRTIGKHVPPPPLPNSPFRWGTEEGVRELLGDGVAELRAERRSFAFRYRSAQHFVDYFRGYYGPSLKAFETLDAEGKESLERDLIELIGRFNSSGDETVVVPSDYFEVVAIRG